MTSSMTLYAVTTTALTLVTLGALFIPMERAFSLRAEQGVFRNGWLTDLAFFLGHYLLWGGAALWVMTATHLSIQQFARPYLGFSLENLPWLAQAALIVILGDLANYWLHRLQHRVPFLWRFHAVHHTAEHLDWLAAHRVHPIDLILTQLVTNLPALILGFPLETIAGYAAFRGLWAIYIHSNARLPLGPLGIFIGAPEIHQWHHVKDRVSCNYGNLSPLMDIAFGTYVAPRGYPKELGIDEPYPQDYLGQLVRPFWTS